METKICAHCGDKFISSHVQYRPKVKYTIDGTLFYCSDACMEGVVKGSIAECGCDYRKIVLVEWNNLDKYVCLLHSLVMEVPSVASV